MAETKRSTQQVQEAAAVELRLRQRVQPQTFTFKRGECPDVEAPCILGDGYGKVVYEVEPNVTYVLRCVEVSGGKSLVEICGQQHEIDTNGVNVRQIKVGEGNI